MIDLAASPERSTGGFQRDPRRGGRHKGVPRVQAGLLRDPRGWGRSEAAPLAQAGFTLIEIVITLVLVAIIAGVTGMLILQGSQAFVSGERRSDATNQARVALERMLREIRTIREAGAIMPLGNPASLIGFTDLNGSIICFAHNAATSVLERTEGACPPAGLFVPVPLANDATAFQVQYFDKAGALAATPAQVWQIQFDLTVTKNSEPQTVRARVYPRNFT